MLTAADGGRGRSRGVRIGIPLTLLGALVVAAATVLLAGSGPTIRAIEDNRPDRAMPSDEQLRAPVRIIHEFRGRAFNELDAPFDVYVQEFVRHRSGEVTITEVEPWRMVSDSDGPEVCALVELPADDEDLPCPPDAHLYFAEEQSGEGSMLRQLTPFGMRDHDVVREYLRTADSVQGTVWEPRVHELGLEPHAVLLVRTVDEKSCGEVGFDCGTGRPLRYEEELVFHAPSGVLLSEIVTLDGVELRRFEVTSIAFEGAP